MLSLPSSALQLLLLVLLFLLQQQTAAAGALKQLQQQQQQQPLQLQLQQKLRQQQQLVQLYSLAVSEISKNPAAFAKAVKQQLQYSTEPDVSRDCGAAYRVYLQGLLGLVGGEESEATQDIIKMLDSAGKPAAGLLEGNIRWLGMREECEGIRLPVRNQTSRQLLFESRGRYCVYAVGSAGGGDDAFSGTLQGIGSALAERLEWGVCSPSTCNATESQAVTMFTFRTVFGFLGPILGSIPGLRDLLEQLSSVELVVKKCPLTSHEAQESLHTGAIIMIAVTLVLVAVVLVATCVTGITIRRGLQLNGRGAQALKSFCLYTNLTKLFAPAASGSLHCLNGIRVLSIFWVILGHVLLVLLGFISNIQALLTDFRKRWQAVIIINATMSVDTFFLLSGLLVSYLFFKKVGPDQKRAVQTIRSVRFWAVYYFHRYWRLTPPLMFFVFFYSNVARYFGDSYDYPTDRRLYDIPFCEERWWTLLLYVQNFVKPLQACIGHSWYLANDMQMFWVSPVMLLPFLFGGLPVGAVVVAAVVAGSMLASGLVNSAYGFRSGSLPMAGGLEGYFADSTYFELIYVKPYCRVGAYAIGILLGYVLATRKSVRLPRPLVPVLWLVAVAGGLALLYVPRQQIAGIGDPRTVAQGTAYWTVLRPGFALCVAWVVFACVYGYGGPVNSLLSWSWWAPLAKLTYCAYLVHLLTQYMMLATLDQTLKLNDSVIILTYLSTLFASFLAALLLSMLVEAPLLGLEKLLLSGVGAGGSGRGGNGGSKGADSEVAKTDKIEKMGKLERLENGGGQDNGGYSNVGLVAEETAAVTEL